MTTITTFDILKALPFEDQLKDQIMEKFDTLTPDQQYAISNTIWDSYNILYNLKLEENVALAHERVKNGQEQLDSEFYNRVKRQTNKKMMSDLKKTITTEDLSDTREELEKIIKQTH